MLQALWDQADARTRREGLRWYVDARIAAQQISDVYGLSIQQAAGMIAALSPRTTWAENVFNAWMCASGRRVATLTHCREKAEAIRDGARITQVLKGPKVLAFYRAILGDKRAVVVDSWMLRAIGHHREQATTKQYERAAQTIARAAAAVGVCPRDFQAVIWCQVRGASQ
jgi:hypothetical protein